MFNTDELFEFLGELRQSGFEFSTEQYIAMHDLLLTLAAQGHWPRVAKRLRTHLAPILCTSPKEQEIFYDRFDNWLASRPELIAPLTTVNEPEKEIFLPESDLQKFVRRLRPWRWMLAAATVLLLGIAAAIFLRPESIVWLTLQGRVFAPDQSPLAGAEVLFLDQNTTTDSAGHFAFHHLPKDSSAQLSVTHPNFAPHQRLITLNRTDTSRLLIQLDSLPLATKSDPVSPQPISKVEETPQSQLEALVERINRFADQVEADQQPKSALARAYRDHFEMIRIGVTSLPLLIFGLWWWWQWRLRRLLLEKHSTANTPEMQRLVVKGSSDELFRGPAFRRTAQQLRRHREVASSQLDAPATVRATIGQGGWFTPVYLGRQVLPEYLVLIDRATFHDQQARRVDELVARLREDGVFVDRYYFDGDPRRCRRDDPQAPLLTLEELANRHPEHRLLIFSDGLGFMHPLTNKPQRWLELFSAWHDRALLTPEFPNQWGYREIALAGLDFVILPATQAGLAVLVDTIQKNAPPPLTRQNRSDAFPEMLHERPRLYLERHEPEPATVDRLCGQLQAYLGHDGYAWFSACAVYPVPTWDLTIYLGYSLKDAAGEKLITEERLLKLARLPWLRFGTMPDWLRLRLIADLPREQERAIRQALEELLKSVLAQPHEGFVLDIARPVPLLKRRNWRRLLEDFLRTTPEQSKLYDFVFLSFMSGRRPSKLAVNVPNLLRRFFYRRGQAMFSLRPAAAFSLAVGFALCGWKISSYNLIPPTLVMPRFQIVSEDPQFRPGMLTPNLARSDSAWSYYAISLARYQGKMRADTTIQSSLRGQRQWQPTYCTWLVDTLSHAIGLDSAVVAVGVIVQPDLTESVHDLFYRMKQVPLYLTLKAHAYELTVTAQILAGAGLPTQPVSGAEIIINGTRIDTTNAAGQFVYSFKPDSATRKLVAKIQKPNVSFVETEKTITLIADQQNYAVTFVARTRSQTYGMIRLNSPMTGDVFVDALYVGKVDSGVLKEFSVAQGKHSIEVKSASGTSTDTTIVIFSGETFTLNLKTNVIVYASTTRPPTKWALLVGINKYKNRKIVELQGAVNDVMGMKQLLIGKYEFPEKNITVLLNEQATRKAIIDAFQNLLIAKAERYDNVVFHFSGMGGKVQDISGDESDGFDETIVPHDSRNPEDGAFDISDDELAIVLQQLARKTQNITVILDACQSGSILRGDAPSRFTSVDIRQAQSQGEKAVSSHGISGNESDLGPVMMISASNIDEIAYEYRVGSTTYGALTYFLIQTLLKAPNAITYREMMYELTTSLAAVFPRQHPQIAGKRLDALVFGDFGKSAKFLSVLQVEGKRVLLSGGSSLLVTAGSIYAVYRPGTIDKRDTTRYIGRVKISSVEAFTAWSEIEESKADIPLNAAAFETHHYYGDMQLPIRLEFADDSTFFKEIRNTFVAYKNREDLVKFVGKTQPYAIKLALSPDRKQLLLLDPEVRVIKTFHRDTLDLQNHLLGTLTAIARWYNLFNLQNQASDLTVFMTMRRWQDYDSRERRPINLISIPQTADGRLSLYDQDIINVTIKNLSEQTVYCYLLDLGTDGRISYLYPGRGGQDSPLAPRDSVVSFAMQVSLPEGLNALKLIATTYPVDFSELEQVGYRSIRGEATAESGLNSPLGRLLNLAYGGSRNVRAIDATSIDDWTTDRITFYIKSKNNSTQSR